MQRPDPQIALNVLIRGWNPPGIPGKRRTPFHPSPGFPGTSGSAATYLRMKAALIVLASLLAASSAAADPLERLRNASANELCWDTVRSFAREKYPTVRLGDPVLTQASFAAQAGPSVKESRKNFPGIRTC